LRRRRRGHWRRRGVASFAKQLLDATDGVAFDAEKAMDTARECDIRRAIVAAIAGALQRPQARKFRFPVTQDVLGNAKLRG